MFCLCLSCDLLSHCPSPSWKMTLHMLSRHSHHRATLLPFSRIFKTCMHARTMCIADSWLLSLHCLGEHHSCNQEPWTGSSWSGKVAYAVLFVRQAFIRCLLPAFQEPLCIHGDGHNGSSSERTLVLHRPVCCGTIPRLVNCRRVWCWCSARWQLNLYTF